MGCARSITEAAGTENQDPSPRKIIKGISVDYFHCFQELAGKQFASDYDVILVVDEFLDMQEEPLYATGIQTLHNRWPKRGFS